MILVKFIRSWRSYQSGENAGFDDVQAKDLVDQGFAKYRTLVKANAASEEEAAKAAEAEAARLAEEEAAKAAEAEAAKTSGKKGSSAK